MHSQDLEWGCMHSQDVKAGFMHGYGLELAAELAVELGFGVELHVGPSARMGLNGIRIWR